MSRSLIPVVLAALLWSESASAIPLPDKLECVPFARQISGIQIYGDAHTWWGQADGRYRRGQMPRLGAVLAFKPHGAMQLGHVATVSAIIDSRTLLVSHANWSLIDGRRGQIERNVRVIDVSPAGDWSAVRVWYAPLADLGSTAWPVYGFIYPDRAVAPALYAKAPKLGYAKLAQLETRTATARPAGRLAYLARLLPKLR